MILDPRFHPIFRRMSFLRDYSNRTQRPKYFAYLANELLDFVNELEMGVFYRKKIKRLLDYWAIDYAVSHRVKGIQMEKETVMRDPQLTQAAYKRCADEIEALLIELLRYQKWIAQPFKRDA